MDQEANRARHLLRRCLNVDIPLGALGAQGELRAFLDALQLRTVDGAREKGATWDEIAEVMGLTRQGLHERLRRQRARLHPGGSER